MKPSELSQSLRRIAAKIEASKNPRRDLVAADLKKLIQRTASAFEGREKEIFDLLVNHLNGLINEYKSGADMLGNPEIDGTEVTDAEIESVMTKLSAL